MIRILATLSALVLLVGLTASVAHSQQDGTVYLGGFMLLRMRTTAGGFSAEQRAAALQMRANALLQLGKGIPRVTTMRAGKDVNILTDRDLFVTVTESDARANRTTTDKLAAMWAHRLRAILPQATPDKPGVGLSGGRS